VSPFHLAHLFRDDTGLSVHQYLLRLRMALALRRLGDDETSLSRLALDLGFSSHSHFTACFRRQFNASPAEIRATIGMMTDTMHEAIA
jgi:AraC family transcriptional regulator